jgi:hypothetical protein
MITSPETPNGIIINVRQAPVINGVGGHLYIEAVDPKTNQVIQQLDGMAVDAQGNKVNLGTSDHRLQIVTDQQWENRENHPSQTLYSTNDPQEAQRIMQNLQQTANRINDESRNSTNNEYQYNLFAMNGGVNSNVAFNTLITNLATEVDIPPETLENARNLGGINPGSNKLLPLTPDSNHSAQLVAASEVSTTTNNPIGEWLYNNTIGKLVQMYENIASIANPVIAAIFPPKPEDAIASAPPADTPSIPRSANRPATTSPEVALVAETPNNARSSGNWLGV